MLDVTHIQVHV